MLGLLFAVTYLFTSLIGAGYIFRIFVKESTSIFPTAVERISGFSLCALLSLLTLLLFKSILMGGILAFILTVLSLCKLVATKQLKIGSEYNYQQWLSLFIKLIFLACVAIPYAGLIYHRANHLQLPNVFDLPKQLSAIIAVYHAAGWPVPNPYFPSMDFAYNIIFYIPLAVVCKLSKSINNLYPVYAIALIWVVWNVLSLIESSLEALRLNGKYYFVGIIFASFFAGFTALFVKDDYNNDVLLAVVTKTFVRADDLFFSYLYVPQHLFAILCLISAWLVLNMNGDFVRRLFWQNLLLSCACLTSYILAPIGFIVFALFSLLNLHEAIKFKKVLFFVIAAMFYVATTLPFIYVAKTWAGDSAVHFSLPGIHDGWQYFAIEIGMILLYLVFGMNIVLKNIKQKCYLSYLMLLSAAIPILFFMHYSDSMIKASLYLRIVMIPMACIGFIYLYSKLKTKHVFLLYFTCIFPFIYSILLSFITINHFISLAHTPIPYEKRALIRVIRSIPEDLYLYLPNDDSTLAALSGHLVYINPFSVRSADGYLPVRDRQDARKIVSALIKNNYDPNSIYIVSNSVTPAALKSGDITPYIIRKVHI